MRGACASFVVVLSIGCASPPASTATPSDAGLEASTAIDATPEIAAEDPAHVRCGDPPWMPHTWKWNYGYGDKKPLKGFRARLDLCPDLVAISGDDGTVVLDVPAGARYSVLIDYPASSGKREPTAYGEFLATFPRSDAWYLLEVNEHNPAFETDLESGVIHAMPYVGGDGVADPCKDFDGSIPYVVGHPEARVRFFDAMGKELTADAAPKGSSMWIEGIHTTDSIVVAGTKPGCKIVTYDPLSAKTTKIFPGYVSYVRFEVQPLPDGGVE